MPNISVISELTFEETEDNLYRAVDANGLKLFTVVDHGLGAKSVDQDIGQSKLFIFGNPRAGTPLIMDDPEMGLALPLKILITAPASGPVRLSYPDIEATSRDYDLDNKGDLIAKIAASLANLTAVAANKIQRA